MPWLRQIFCNLVFSLNDLYQCVICKIKFAKANSLKQLTDWRFTAEF